MLLVSFYDKKYEMYLNPMTFENIDMARYMLGREIRDAYERNEVTKDYLKCIEARIICYFDKYTGEVDDECAEVLIDDMYELVKDIDSDK